MHVNLRPAAGAADRGGESEDADPLGRSSECPAVPQRCRSGVGGRKVAGALGMTWEGEDPACKKLVVRWTLCRRWSGMESWT